VSAMSMVAVDATRIQRSQACNVHRTCPLSGVMRTCPFAGPMSAFAVAIGGKADIVFCAAHVCL